MATLRYDDHSSDLPETAPRFAFTSMNRHPERVTTRSLANMKRDGKRITMLTAYDYPTAQILDEAGVDILLVGDSLGMVMQGRDSTVRVTLDHILYHTELVARAAQRAMVIADLPFPEGQLGIERTVESSARLLQQTGCHGVKLEGGAESAARIAALVDAGIPVIAHVGLRPQSVHVLGGYRVQRDEQQLTEDAVAAERAGAFVVLIECVPRSVAARITEQLEVPTIGIGAGPHVDGQVLVTNDLIGLTADYVPRFVKRYAECRKTISDAASRYIADVRDGSFPEPQHGFE